jgi:hypothetical protein
MTTEHLSKHRTPNRRNILQAGTTLAAASALGAGGPIRRARAQQSPAALTPSPSWTQALPSGPDMRVKITESYATLVARDAYFWAWPLVNMYNRRVANELVKDAARTGPVVTAPINHLAMFTDYIDPGERLAVCPNQDVVYGIGFMALDQSAIVVQVPDFGDRFWVYSAYDTRTDEFSQLGKMYGNKPGFYLMVGRNWTGETPKGITKVFRATTNSGSINARIFMDDTPEDKQAVQSVLRQIMAYPLTEYDGTMKSTDWSKLPVAPATTTGDEEIRWVDPEKFFDELPAVFNDAPPMPGEEARYAQVLAVLEAAKADPKIKAAMTKAALEADAELIKPVFDFRNFGVQLPHHWSTVRNGASFGTDYFMRTAIAKSNILVNTAQETTYFYQDLDGGGARLNGVNRYIVTFAKDQTPPVDGFWSLTLYNKNHFFEPNPIKRYSVGTKNKTLNLGADGSLTIHVQVDSPGHDKDSNWLPAPKDGDFSLYVRAYWPKAAITDGSWTPPAVQLVN